MSDGQPLWGDVADGLRAAILAGDYAPGDTIPSEAHLAAQYYVSRDTVRRALNQLEQEGLITEGRGRLGRQVRVSRPLTFYAVRSESAARGRERRARGVDAWLADAADEGRTAGQEISVEYCKAPAEVASRLGVPAGELVVARRRLRTVDGEPHNLNDTYYPRSIAEGTAIMHPDDVVQGTIALMADMGYVQTRFRDDLGTRMPTPAEADRLKVPKGVPLLVQYRTGYAGEEPVKVTITLWPGDRTRLAYDFPA